jgi:hypothetical protein
MRRFVLSVSVVASTLLFGIGAGCCGAELTVEAVGHAERVIYHSPETPGYTSWVGLWQLPNGRLRCDFRQVTGPKEKPVSTTPVLESRDSGRTWTRVNADSSSKVDLGSGGGIYQMERCSCRGMAILRDGTLVRPVVWPSDIDGSGSVVRSTDGGKTWSEEIFFLPAKEYRAWPTGIRVLRDGRLVLFAGCAKRADVAAWQPNLTKTMFVSSDKGKTWSQPIILMPTNEGVCEESDFCELPNGDLFWVHRVEHFPDHQTVMPSGAAPMGPNPPQSYWYSDRMQSIVHKEGKAFVPGKCQSAPFPHSGYPAVLYTQEGLILHLATDGVCWTADLGKTWTRLNIPGTPYYPKALQLKDGTIVCVGHNGSDDKYGTVDQSIKQQTFRLRVQHSAGKL